MSSVLLRAISAELLKYRRTAALRLALGVPALYCLSFLIVALVALYRFESQSSSWGSFGQLHKFWSAFVFPFGVVVVTALSSQLTQSDGMWSRILVQPIDRACAYLAHVTTVALLVCGGALVYGLGILCTGLIARWPLPIDWSMVLVRPALMGFAAMPLVVIQMWLGSRQRSLALPLGFGIGSVLGAMGLMRFAPALAYPLFPALINDPSLRSTVTIAAVALTALFVFVGTREFCSRDCMPT